MDENKPLLKTEEPKTDENEQTPKNTDEFEQALKPKRTHYTKAEIETIQGLMDEEYSTREIAIITNRTVSGIRNLKRRLNLTYKTQDEITALTTERDALIMETLELESRLEALNQETANQETLKKDCLELKKAVDLYKAHGNQIRGELEALVRSQADAIAIQKIFQWLKID